MTSIHLVSSTERDGQKRSATSRPRAALRIVGAETPRAEEPAQPRHSVLTLTVAAAAIAAAFLTSTSFAHGIEPAATSIAASPPAASPRAAAAGQPVARTIARVSAPSRASGELSGLSVAGVRSYRAEERLGSHSPPEGGSRWRRFEDRVRTQPNHRAEIAGLAAP
jgi:hypothetical protein